MLFNSISYLLFFPVVCLLNFILPRRIRPLCLLVASYFFYMCWNASYALLMLTSTAITYGSGIMIQRYHDTGKHKAMKVCVALSFLSNLLILVFFKYANFIVTNVNELMVILGGQHQIGYFNVLLPVGISFYTFQALGYTMDVYRQTVQAEKNFIHYALFVSFFPQLVAGPIERTGNLLPQLKEKRKFSVDAARDGLLWIAWGLFMKMVLADNLARIVNPVYDQFANYSGVEIIIATFCFAFQIYCDFAAYSTIAYGSAKVMGIQLMENFRSPYFGTSVAGFWRRWHISLTTWFTDYLYIPLGGNRKGTMRKYANTMIVFLVSGFWHGANWTFVLWGVLNGAMIVVGEATKGVRERGMRALGIQPESKSHVFFQRVITFLLINCTWVFFRAPDIETALQIFQRIFSNLSVHKLFSASIFAMWPNAQVLFVVLCAMIVLLFVDGRRNQGLMLHDIVLNQGLFLRWAVYIGLLFAIIIFGVYGKIFAQTRFIYFQF